MLYQHHKLTVRVFVFAVCLAGMLALHGNAFASTNYAFAVDGYEVYDSGAPFWDYGMGQAGCTNGAACWVPLYNFNVWLNADTFGPGAMATVGVSIDNWVEKPNNYTYPPEQYSYFSAGTNPANNATFYVPSVPGSYSETVTGTVNYPAICSSTIVTCTDMNYCTSSNYDMTCSPVTTDPNSGSYSIPYTVACPSGTVWNSTLSACVASDYGQACTSSANACGMTNTGTYDQNGNCPAPPNSSCPAPTATVSAPSSCTIPAGGSSCSVSISWTSQNSYIADGSTVGSQLDLMDPTMTCPWNNTGNCQSYTWVQNTNYWDQGANGSVTLNLAPGQYAPAVWGQAAGSSTWLNLAHTATTVSCASGSSWNSSLGICASNNAGSSCTSPANTCGQTSSGTYNTSGVCVDSSNNPVVTPADSQCVASVQSSLGGAGCVLGAGQTSCNVSAWWWVSGLPSNATLGLLITGPGISMLRVGPSISTPESDWLHLANLAASAVRTGLPTTVSQSSPHLESVTPGATGSTFVLQLTAVFSSGNVPFGNQITLAACPNGYTISTDASGNETCVAPVYTCGPCGTGTDGNTRCQNGVKQSECSYQCSASSCVAPPNPSFTATPLLVHKGDTVNVTWNFQNVSSCQPVTSSNLGEGPWDPGCSSGTNTCAGSHASNPIETQTIYTLSCKDLATPPNTITKTATVTVVPVYNEK